MTVSTLLAAAALEGVCLGQPELEEELAANFRARLDRTLARLRERIDAPITGKVIFGNPASTLCDLAASGKYDLVVMATHGRSPLGASSSAAWPTR